MLLRTAVLIGLLWSQASGPAQTKPESTLLESARFGQIDRAGEALAMGASVDTADRRGFTALMWASAGGYAELVRFLLERGAAADRRATEGTTALMLAAANGFTDVIRVLVSRGANVAAARNGVTARQLAVERGHVTAATDLQQAEALGAGLVQAANEGHDALVRQLLARGAPVNITDQRGATPLLIAARNGDIGIVQYLLSRGADPSIRDAQGQTVFDWAERAPETGKYVVALLVDRGVARNTPRPAALAQAPPVTSSLRALEMALSRIPPASGPIRQAQQRANNALSQLQALSAGWPAESPEDYRVNLATDVSALEAALSVGNVVSLAATVQAVAEDLEIKLEHCTRSGGKLGGAVTVRVRTLQGAQEIKSWQVFYMPRVLEAAENASPDLFPRLSSPTEDALVPGRYVMWVRDPGTARLGERNVVKVGEGKKELLLDLPVPPDVKR